MLISEEKPSRKITQKYVLVLVSFFLFALILFYLSTSYAEGYKFKQHERFPLVIFPFFQIVFDFTFFLISIFLTCGALFYYSITDNENHAIFGIIFLVIGALSIFYYLIINQKIIPVSDYSVFISYFWWKEKIVVCLAFIGGILLIFIKKLLRIRKKIIMLIIFSVILFTAIFSNIYFSLFLKTVTLVYSSESILLWEFIPIGLYLFLVIPGMYFLYKKDPSYFFMGIIIGFFLNTVSEVFFLFNSSVFFTRNLRIVQLVVIIASLPPLLGIFFDNFLHYNVIKKNFLKLARVTEEKNEFVSSLTEILSVHVKRIEGYLSSLIAGINGSLNIPQVASLNYCHRDSKKIQSLIQELSELAFIESEKLLYDLEPYNLTFAIKIFLERKVSQTQGKSKVTVRLPDHEVYCLWDIRRGNQIVKNLITIIDLAYPNIECDFILREDDSKIYWECKTSTLACSSIDKILKLKSMEGENLEIYLLKTITERLVKDQGGELNFGKEVLFSLNLKNSSQLT